MPSPFDWSEIAALAIMAFYFATRFRRGRAAGVAFVQGFALIAPASWLAEDTCIRLYGFYAYDPRWHVFLDRMPVLVAAIWPFVILSARELAARLYPGRRAAIVLAGSAIVVFDAALMECVATSTGLWTWFEPGIFGVPLMGILGWGCFAAACILGLETLRGPARLLVVPLAPLLTHGLLLALWWGLMRWVTVPVADMSAATGALLASVAATGLALRWRRRATIPLDEMVARMVAASFFFALLALYHRSNVPLVVFALSFAPPYVALMSFERAPGVQKGDSGRPASTQAL